MTERHVPDWSDNEHIAEFIDEDKVYEVQQIYRVVDAETNQPLATGGYHGRQHVYLKEATAKSVATQHNNGYSLKNWGSSERIPNKPVKVQVADAEWRDL